MYVDAFFKRGGNEEVIRVVERVNGVRVFREYAPDYHFYINDARGTHKTIYGNYVRKVTPKTYAEKQKLIKTMSSNVVRWESDVDPVFRCLEQNYRGSDSPKLHIAFFDIETSYDKDTGWSEPGVAANYITSISIYLQWLDEMVCLALPPDTVSWDEAQTIAARVAEKEHSTVVMVKTEAEMLSTFMDIVEDADILSGWNSEAFDIPYTVNRIRRVMGKHEASRLCLWNQNPKSRTFDRGGKEQVTYDLIGRNHADYLQLYQKYTYEEKQSYALDSIAEAELGERKVQYDGTLDELYHDDFEKFLEYNIQDTRLLDKLDKKLQFIDLANNVAHENCVLLQTTMGAVAVTDQAVLMEAHSHGLVCQDKKRDKEEEGRAAGGWVATPKKGLHHWIGSVDLNSLYPSTIRAFNMSPETIVGQIRLTRTNAELDAHVARGGKYTFAGWWNDRYNVLEMDDFFSDDIGTMLTLDMENGDSVVLSARELRELVFSQDSSWCISANGTIFRTDRDGMIPMLLSRWYAERKTLQQRAAEILQINLGLELPEQLSKQQWPAFTVQQRIMKELLEFKGNELQDLLSSGDLTRVTEFLGEWGLTVSDGKIQPSSENETAWSDAHEYFDKKQHVRKISLNSAYGALLNMGSRFYDQRIGQSTTLSGRSINRHQASKINELLTGEYKEYGETQIYCDTDSETADTLHITNYGTKTIEELFENCVEVWEDGDKEYAYDPELMVMTYDTNADEPYMGHTNYIYRHKVSKDLYEVEDRLGNVITVTEDHSVMVLRNGKLIEAKPYEISTDDTLISLKYDTNQAPADPPKNVVQLVHEMIAATYEQDIATAYRAVQDALTTKVEKTTLMLYKAAVKEVRKARRAENEYVYDIGMRNESQPWFFGNNILLHNSVYFSAYPIFKEEINRGELSWTKDDVIGLYDSMVPMINDSFPVFLKDRFNVPEARSTGVIKCGREIVAEAGIWMVKKRYACLMIDKDGNRYDTNGKPGKVKAMGLDLRRSDTPKFMQEFLSEILLDTLTNKGENFVVSKVRDFKARFEDMKPWQQGTPKKVNKLSHYRDKIEDAGVQKLKGIAVGNLHVPGHVTASLNWNRLREIHNDHQSTKIIDGQRIVVCKLKITPENNMSSIAYPVDETRLPEWFTSLPFDTGEMMSAIVDKKVSNLLSVLKWDFSRAKKEHAHLETLFDFS